MVTIDEVTGVHEPGAGAGDEVLVERLETDSDAVVFARPVHVRRRKEGDGYVAEVLDASTSASGSTPGEALERLIATLRAEAGLALRTPAHRMTAKARERKGVLLDLVDVVASGLSQPLPPWTWELGHVELDPDGRRTFRVVGSLGERRPLSDELAAADEEQLRGVRMGRVATSPDGLGHPVGPVVELGPRLDGPIRDERW